MANIADTFTLRVRTTAVPATLELDSGDDDITVSAEGDEWEVGFTYTIGDPKATGFEFKWAGARPYPTHQIVPSSPDHYKTVNAELVPIGASEIRTGIAFGVIPTLTSSQGSPSQGRPTYIWYGIITIVQP